MVLAEHNEYLMEDLLRMLRGDNIDNVGSSENFPLNLQLFPIISNWTDLLNFDCLINLRGLRIIRFL